MSLLHKKRFFGITGAQDLIPPRSTQSAHTGTVYVTSETALRHSAVWACLRLRANLISTMPVDAFRTVPKELGGQVEVAKPPVLVTPGGERVDMQEWLYSSQFDLDRAGNCFGLITERWHVGQLPARVDLVPVGEVAIQIRGGELWKYRIGSEIYDPADVWHERQYTVAGLHVGLSPVAYAAWSIGEYLSIQQFASDWFGTGGIPKAHLKNQAKMIDQKQATEIKERFKSTVTNGDLFVTGADWTYDMIQADQSNNTWINDAKQYGVGDVARFFDCPGDLIDAAVRTGGNINYANQVQRNLQFLVMNLGPAVFRRERALSKWLPQPQFVKLNSNALLRMDPKTQAEMFEVQIRSRQTAPSEARAIMDRPPFTDGQLAEFDRLFPPKGLQPSSPSMTG